ncbi:MAG: antitoxin [Acidobacteria bacterium]|nr:antitoxin [Acidobacteriota bacterium]
MRTTLTLDPDVAQKLKSRMMERKAPFKQVINDALRRGLTAAPPPVRERPFRVVPHSFGFRPGVDVSKLNQLLDELEAQEFAAKMKARRKRR